MKNNNTNSEKEPLEGCDEAFKEKAENGDDKLLIPDVFECEEFEEW